MKRHHIIIGCFILFQILLSCGNDDENLVDLYAFEPSPEIILRLDQNIYENLNSNRKNSIPKGDPINIQNISKENNLLKIIVSYSGGCEEHNFEVVWDGIVYLDSPCFMNLILVHNGNNDPCEALITQTLEINLAKLIGEINEKDTCDYNIFTTFNSSETPDIKYITKN